MRSLHAPDAKKVDLEKLLGDLVEISRQIRAARNRCCSTSSSTVRTNPRARLHRQRLRTRIGQIITNLIENARSFVSEQNGRIVVRLTRSRSRCIVYVETTSGHPGGGHRPYLRALPYTTVRRAEDFGQNSGLGPFDFAPDRRGALGTLRAEKHRRQDGHIGGRRVVLSLPASRTRECAFVNVHGTAIVLAHTGC